MDWYLQALRKYATFSGRACRAEYWYFFLMYVLIYVVLSIVDGIAGTYSSEDGIGALGTVFVLAMLLPSVAVGVRRLHDIDRTGWWLLIALVPLVGAIVLLVFAVQAGTQGDNQYGPDPRAEAA
jgi:uncharacterized membrane protein YhaH (DUF805 family)